MARLYFLSVLFYVIKNRQKWQIQIKCVEFPTISLGKELTAFPVPLTSPHCMFYYWFSYFEHTKSFDPFPTVPVIQ